MINIKVLKDCAEVSYKLPNSEKRQTKIIGISDIPALFDTRITFDSGPMPLFGQQNAYGVQRIIQKDSSIVVFIQCINPFVNVQHTNFTELSEGVRSDLGISHIKTKQKDITMKGEDNCTIYKNIHLPNLLMAVQLQKDSSGITYVNHSGLLCYQDSFVTDQTQLYRFPFSNVYKDSVYGKICWGSQSCDADSVSQSIGIIHSFLGGIMNTHLFQSFKVKNHTFNCSSQILAYLALRSDELETFPYADFNLREVIKYNDLVNYIGQNWN